MKYSIYSLFLGVPINSFTFPINGYAGGPGIFLYFSDNFDFRGTKNFHRNRVKQIRKVAKNIFLLFRTHQFTDEQCSWKMSEWKFISELLLCYVSRIYLFHQNFWSFPYSKKCTLKRVSCSVGFLSRVHWQSDMSWFLAAAYQERIKSLYRLWEKKTR